jgi:hypothetical protein
MRQSAPPVSFVAVPTWDSDNDANDDVSVSTASSLDVVSICSTRSAPVPGYHQRHYRITKTSTIETVSSSRSVAPRNTTPAPAECRIPCDETPVEKEGEHQETTLLLDQRSNNNSKEVHRRSRFFRWVPVYLVRSKKFSRPATASLVKPRSEEASPHGDNEHDLPSDSFIAIGAPPAKSDSTSEESTSSTSDVDVADDDDEDETNNADNALMDDDGNDNAGLVRSPRQVHFSPVVKRIHYRRYSNKAAVWWTKADRKKTISEANHEIDVYIAKFPETFRTIVRLCHQHHNSQDNVVEDYSPMQPIMPIRGLLRPCLNRIARNDEMVSVHVQNAPRSVAQFLHLQQAAVATTTSVALYTSYSGIASRMARYLAQADARAAQDVYLGGNSKKQRQPQPQPLGESSYGDSASVSSLSTKSSVSSSTSLSSLTNPFLRISL